VLARRPIREFVFGAFYLVCGIYSLGFGMFLSGLTKPLSGNLAYVMTPDGLFPYEVAAFIVFGMVFLLAAVIHFSVSLRSYGVVA
jgi:hypothetical protein